MGLHSGASACGLNWSEPKSYFEGVSFQGYVFLVETLGEVELRDGKKLPIRAIFRSESNSTSPYLGHGWELPILESYIVQMDDRWFRVVEPTGWYRLFWRDEKDPTVLHGQGNWKGVIRGNSISVMADCGDRLDFRDGRITAMQLKGETLEVERSLDGMARLKEGPATLLAIQKSMSKDGIGLRFGNSAPLEVNYTQRPVIEVIGGQPVVRQQLESLGSIEGEKGENRVWAYAVDERLFPTITIGERKITWDPTTRHVIADGQWTYDVKPGEGTRDYAAIGRKNSKNQTEFWHRNEAKGEEIVKELSGVKRVTSWFTNGRLARKIRKTEEFSEGKSRLLYQTSYDEKGNLSRELLENGEVNRFTYSEDGRLLTKTRVSKTGEAKETVEYAPEARMTIVRSSDGRMTEYHYDEDGRESKMYINGNLHSDTSYGPNRSWEKVVVYNQKTGEPARTFFKELDTRGREVTERITEHSGDYPEIYREFFYDAAGQLVKKLDSQQGTVEYFDGPDGKRIARLLK